jgi:hypothetical protein
MQLHILNALALFSVVYKGNQVLEDFEGTDEGIELENMAFQYMENAGFDVEQAAIDLHKADVFERARHMFKVITSDYLKGGQADEPTYVRIDSPSKEDLVIHLRLTPDVVSDLYIRAGSLSEVEGLNWFKEEAKAQIKALNVFEGVMNIDQDGDLVFRIK